MIKIGEYNKLKVVKDKEFGFFLGEIGVTKGEEVLLPKSLLNGILVNVDDEVEVFVYRDSEDRPVATMKKPLITVGEVGYLEVVGQSKIGAFANMGLERDIFIPIKEQKHKLKTGCKYLFYAYLDKTGRLAATTFVEEYITDIAEGLKTDQTVTAIIYGKSGTTVRLAIDGKYKAIILGNELYEDFYPGEEISCRVRKIYEDGTVGLSTRKKRLDARDELKEDIIKYLKKNGGVMPYNDKSSPEDIKEVFKTSKNYFKMTLGGLMKEGRIKQDKEGTTLIK